MRAHPCHTADDLIRARRHGLISRRALIARARDLGFSLPVIGVILHATGDAALGAPAQSGVPIAATEPTNPSGGRKPGATVTAGLAGSIDTMHPYLTSLDGPTFDALAGVMEGLLAYDSDQQLQPQLAESFSISDDGLSYTFALRQGVTFHNGDPFTAQDVVATWQAIMDANLPAWSRLGWEKIANIDVPGDGTVVIHTSEVYAPFLSAIASGRLNNAAISPASVLTSGAARVIDELSSQPIGTGPMRFASYAANEVQLTRNGAHWAGTPSLDGIRIKLYPTAEAQYAAFAAGEIDVVPRLGLPGASFVQPALALDNRIVLAYPSLSWGHLDLKQVGFLRETPVRQALAHAIPVSRLIVEALGGEAVPAAADQAPGSAFVDDTVTPRKYDPKQAARLLATAGFAPDADGILSRDGAPLAIEMWAADEDPTAPAALAIIAAAWGAIGVATRVRTAPGTELWGPMGYQFSDAMTAGYFRWSNANDPDDMFYWHSGMIPSHPGGPGGNVSAFFHPHGAQDEFDRLTELGLRTVRPSARRRVYYELQQLLAEETPAIFLYWDRFFAACGADVGGFWPSSYTYLTWNAGSWYRARAVQSGPATPEPEGRG